MGAQATIKVDELNGKEIVGTVYEIAASADSASRQFIVKVKFPNPDRELKVECMEKQILQQELKRG